MGLAKHSGASRKEWDKKVTVGLFEDSTVVKARHSGTNKVK